MPELSDQFLAVGLTLSLLVSSASSIIKGVFNGSSAKAKSLLTKGDNDESTAIPVVDEKPKPKARRRSADAFATMERHIIRRLPFVFLLFAVYKLILVELPHREPQQRMSFAQSQSESSPSQWEYAVLKKTLSQEELDALGNEGWELISHKFEIEPKIETYIFKRRKF